jgi:phosphate transport system substrate-binding protein
VAHLDGTGASYPAPLFQRWIRAYRAVAPGVTISYQPFDSERGISDLLAAKSDFGATDQVVSNRELARYGYVPYSQNNQNHEDEQEVFHIPLVVGAVAVTYNLPGVEMLRLSPETLADIFLGNITDWDDPAIVRENPDATLPPWHISVVHRSDPTITTALFTSYLDQVSEEWEALVGSDTTVGWFVGTGAKKNSGVAEEVQETRGAIGYVEMIYALRNELPTAALKNASGSYVAPTLESVSEAATAALKDDVPTRNNTEAEAEEEQEEQEEQDPGDLRVDLINPQTGNNAYPIASFTWVLVRSDEGDEDSENDEDSEAWEKSAALADFLYWALTSTTTQPGFVPLPEPVRSRAVEQLTHVTVGEEPVFQQP